MEKKSVEKKTIIKEVIHKNPRKKGSGKTKKSSPRPKKNSTEIKTITVKPSLKVESMLIENFVSLQKVLVDLSGEVSSLTTQLSRLLKLFEISAKTLAEKDVETQKSHIENKKILEKIENVLEQNRTIARGLTLMHDKINEPVVHSQPPHPQRIIPQPKQTFKPAQKNPMIGGVSEEFHKSISSNEK